MHAWNGHRWRLNSLKSDSGPSQVRIGSALGASIRRIDTAYDTQGSAFLFTSYSDTAGTTIVNQVHRAFSGLGQLTQDCQGHSGAVSTSTTPSVQYAYSEMAGGANHSRLISMTYPNGKVLGFNYNSGVDDALSRLSSISDSTGTLESYKYLGLGTVVERDHPQINVNLTYIQQTGDAQANTDGGDKYTGLDRFGRVIDQLWLNTSTSTATDRFQYGYDRDGNVLWKNNLVNTAFGELYSYDNLNQLSSFQRGTLNSTHTAITGTPSESQSWSPDAVGNFTTITTNGTANNNTFNKQNEETQAGSANLTFDANGNTTVDDLGHTLVYDAWNRLLKVKDSSGNVLETLGYDALSHRIAISASGTTTDFYFSAGWQILEERVGGSVTAQYVWSPVYVDAMILRDRSINGGTLNERLWMQQDANLNVTAIVSSVGAVAERYDQDPYGSQTVLTPLFAIQNGGSLFGWIYGFQGMRFDSVSGLFLSRERPGESPTLGRWTILDPTGIQGSGTNSYEAEKDGVTERVDPDGLADDTPDAVTELSITPGVTFEIKDQNGKVVGKLEHATVGIAAAGKKSGTKVELLKPDPKMPTRYQYNCHGYSFEWVVRKLNKEYGCRFSIGGDSIDAIARKFCESVKEGELKPDDIIVLKDKNGKVIHSCVVKDPDKDVSKTKVLSKNGNDGPEPSPDKPDTLGNLENGPYKDTEKRECWRRK